MENRANWDRLNSILVFTFIVFSLIFANDKNNFSDVIDVSRDALSQRIVEKGIPGSHFLNKRVAHLKTEYSNGLDYTQSARAKKTAWNFQVGDTKDWYAYNFESGVDYFVPSTCRAVGEYCYIFVEDAMWENPGDFMVQQKHADSLAAYFDSKTPASADKGIYQSVVSEFGSPPDIDSDQKIIILVLDIKDGYDPDGDAGFIAGYFDPANQYSTSQVATSNVAEMFYMDANPVNYDSHHMLFSALSTLAHEFQHMVHFNYDWSELSFVNEGCSEVAEVVCGFPVRSPGRYFSDTDKYLFGWEDDDGTHLDDYSRAALWTTYLYDQMPDGFLKNLVQETTIGNYGLENAIKSSIPNTTRLVNEIFNDWVLANLLNDTSIDPKYGYLTSGVDGVPSVEYEYFTANIGPVEEKVSSYAVDYIKYSAVKDLSITFGGSEWVNIFAVKMGSTIVVDQIASGETYNIPDFETNWDVVYFVVANTKNISHTYNFTSTGSGGNTVLELAYDQNEPVGYYPWVTDNTEWNWTDSIGVWFNGVEGSMIDSIKIGFKHPGTAVFKISEYDDSGQQKVSGKTLKDSIVFQVSTTAEVVNSGSDYPYAIPFNNWYTYDLTGDSISGGKDFVVVHKIENDATEPHVLHTEDLPSGSGHSRIFSESTSGPFFWFYLNDLFSDGFARNFLIRAYVSIKDPNAAVDPGYAILPDGYKLSQNYPNPFNPSTSMTFTIPRESNVRISVFDLKGSFVTDLVNGNYRSGNHKAVWNGRNNNGAYVSSGVYLLVMETNGKKLTRKMALIR